MSGSKNDYPVEKKSADQSDEKDLRHFLDNASTQLRRRMKQAQTAGEKAQLSHMRLLEVLIKEQVPANGNSPKN